MAVKPLKIFLHAIDGTGHINAGIGIGQAALKRGHKVYYLLNEAFKGQASLFGIEEILLVDKPKDAQTDGPLKEEDPIKEVSEGMLSNGLLSGANSLEKLKMLHNATFLEDIYQRMVVFEPQIERALDEHKPDLVILDHQTVSPSIQRSNIPFVIIFSAGPLYIINSDKLPPPGSGFATTSDPATWIEFRKVYEKTFKQRFKSFQERLNKEFNFEPPYSLTPGNTAFPQSKFLNIYGYPLELDYQDTVPLPSNYFQIDVFCRIMPKPFTIPKELNVQPGDKLIYVSMGSMGSFDQKLNLKFANILAKTPHKVIFSKGALASEYELPSNAWGEAYVPQTSLLPHVDLVITHGGNNSVTEAFCFGKPMIIHPLFADQFDNAQRVEEKGFGVRLTPYDFTEEELLSAVNRLLYDTQLNERLKAAAKRIETSNSKDKAIQRIEELIEKRRNANV